MNYPKTSIMVKLSCKYDLNNFLIVLIMQLQISGFKSWTLKPPPECWWSCPGEVKTTVGPGDIIVVNTNWWYHSTNVLKGTSVTITNEYIL